MRKAYFYDDNLVGKVRIDEREPSELFLVDGANHIRISWG